MIKNKAILAAALSLTCAAVACSSSGTTSTSTGSGGGSTSATGSTAGAGGTGAGGGPTAPAESCAQPGDKGNDNGVGTFCTPGGGECTNFPKAGLCLADVGQDQWLCTRIGCKMDADCGTAAHCHVDPAGAACIPDKCEPPASTSSSSSSSSGGGAGGSK
jgi:hypothetical protein